MKRVLLATLAVAAALSLSAQTTIDKPVATLKLTRQEVISVRTLKADIEKIEKTVGKALPADKRRELLDSEIDARLFQQYCEREKLVVTEGELSTALQQLKASLGQGATDATLESWAAAQLSFFDAKGLVRQQLLLQRYIQAKRQADVEALKKQLPTADDILKAYELAKSELIRPDTAKVSELFVDLRGLAGDAKTKAAEAFRQAMARLKSDPGKFDELMLRASDPGAAYRSAPSFTVEKTSSGVQLYGQAFLDATFRLKPGEVSPIIENESGLLVVRLNEFLPQKQLGLADTVTVQNQTATVQDFLQYQIMLQRQNLLMAKIQSELVAQLRKEAKVTIYEENLKF